VTPCYFFIEVITGTNLTVRPTKIIAGHEPSKTNELLQAIGKALDKKVSAQCSITERQAVR
jgi:TRAF3-interacting protein 1